MKYKFSPKQINTPQGTENKRVRKLQSFLGNSQEKPKYFLFQNDIRAKEIL